MAVLGSVRARRLAQDVRLHARREAARRRCGGVVDFRSIARRGALYELIARRVESRSSARPAEPLAALIALLGEPPPAPDAGMNARERDARVASILVALEQTR